MFNSESLDAATLPASKNTKVTAQQLAFSANRLADFVAQKEEARIEAETKAHDAITAALVTTSGQVEANISTAENEILYRKERAFYTAMENKEMANLMVMQDRQMADLILKQKTDKHSRESRRRAKIFRKKQVQQIKIKDILMTHQERASKANKLAKTDLAHSIAKFNSHLEAVGKKHAVKISKKESAQERRISNWQKLLNVELDSVERYVNQDEKRDMTKATQFKINHQKAVDKLELEQLRELNDLEITCIRRTADLNNKKMDSDNNFELKNLDSIRESEVTHNAKILDQKSKINDIRIKIKETIADIDDDMEMKRMKIVHQNQKIRLMNQHSQQYSTSTKKWSKTLGHNISKEPEIIPVASSDDDIVLQADADLTRRLKELKESMQEEEQILLKLKEKYQETCAEFKLKSKESREVERENHQSELVELELNQDILFRNLRNTHQYHIQELLKVQRHELFMDQNMRELDVKAMFERRILNTLLDTIADGVINITPTGTITRFNAAAEKMFKAKASSAIGTNIRNYMPHEHSINHDEYLYNYLTTERPKVIGIGRDTFGKTIQGEIFPIHLSVSEVKGEGYHLFNGIATDLTEQVRAKKKIADEEDRKRREQQVLIDELAVYQKRSTNLLQQMLPLDFAQRIMSGETPPPQNYKTSTIFFSDIVGFTSIASACTAMDIVNLLNDLYTYFDAVIDRHDVYKVETIGDAYMVVSGVPTPNGDDHASQIADMALHLLHGIYKVFTCRHNNKKVQIRIGLHTGPCVSGIVGVKMPRYCLFGSTVTYASSMESTSSPMRIQVSETTYKLLRKTGQYDLIEREHEHGHSAAKTYWLYGKKGFEPELPKLEDWPVISHTKG